MARDVTVIRMDAGKVLLDLLEELAGNADDGRDLTEEELQWYLERNKKDAEVLKEWARKAATHDKEGCFGCQTLKDPLCPGIEVGRHIQRNADKAAIMAIRMLGDMLVAAEVNQMVDEAHDGAKETAAA